MLIVTLLLSLWQKDDPLKRIQEEINEVARRERELRQKDGSLSDDHTTHLDNMSGISDDSGISSASSPINGISSNHEKDAIGQQEPATSAPNNENAVQPTKLEVAPVPYKRSFTVNPSSMAHSPASHHNQLPVGSLTRAVSTPQIFTPTKRFAVNGSQKGMMQRFLASRGKYSPAGAPRTGKDLILVKRYFIDIDVEFLI